MSTDNNRLHNAAGDIDMLARINRHHGGYLTDFAPDSLALCLSAERLYGAGLISWEHDLGGGWQAERLGGWLALTPAGYDTLKRFRTFLAEEEYATADHLAGSEYTPAGVDILLDEARPRAAARALDRTQSPVAARSPRAFDELSPVRTSHQLAHRLAQGPAPSAGWAGTWSADRPWNTAKVPHTPLNTKKARVVGQRVNICRRTPTSMS